MYTNKLTLTLTKVFFRKIGSETKILNCTFIGEIPYLLENTGFILYVSTYLQKQECFCLINLL